MQAKISAGTDCLRFLRVTVGNLPATAGNSHEVFIVRVQADFFEPLDVFFDPVPNTLTKVTNCCLWSQWWTLQIWFCSKKNGVFLAGSSNRYPKKTARWRSLHYHQIDRELAVVTFLVFSLIPSEGKITSKCKNWSWIAIETQCIFDKHYWFFLKKT